MTMNKPLAQISFDQILGWAGDNHQAALEAFQRSAQEIIENGHGFKRQAQFGGAREDWLQTCEAALKATDARQFFETHFQPLRVQDQTRPEGLYTGYYEPMAEGSEIETPEFQVPIYAKPADLVSFTADETNATGLSYGRRINGQASNYSTRREIEHGALKGQGLEICWLKSWVDAFFIHVQGNGRVVLPNGKVIRLSYAAKNGQHYTGIGGVLLARGVGTPQTMSMQLLREWMAENPAQMRELLWSNNSFVFFRTTEIENPTLGAIGAAKVNLTPLRSLAVDRQFWQFGTPLFIQTQEPPEATESKKPFNHLMVAQDTGTAIRGIIRGDVYWGWGDKAALNAGHMKSQGQMVALLPKALAKKLAP
jgi:membrane-bound lytic murein transglycosylase A